MEIVWDNNKIFNLIQMYESHRILWDSTNKDYKNKVKKIEAWKSISKSLDASPMDVKTKIHTLRSQFAREKKKVMSTKAEGDEIEMPKWIFYDTLKFLLNETISIGVSDKANKKVYQGNENNEMLLVPPVFVSTSAQRSQSPEPIVEERNQNTTKRKATDHHNEVIKVMKTVKEKYNDKDEFDIYGQYVASELRSMENENAVLRAKSYINNILIDMRLGKYNNSFMYDTPRRSETATSSSTITRNATGQPLHFEFIEEISPCVKPEISDIEMCPDTP